MTLGRRVNPVSLIKAGDTTYAFKQEWDYRGFVFLGEFRIDRSESAGVRFAEVRRQLHAGQHDNYVGITGADALDH
jgi:hypothetical protein